MAKISVIVPVYNSAYLPELIESVISQTMKDWQLICVNDGAPDNSLEVLQRYADKDSRILVLDQPNAGCSAAINKGAQYVVGDYVFLIGHDDYINPDLFENVCKRAAETDADCIIPDVMMGFNTKTAWSWNKEKKTDLATILTGRVACAMTIPWELHCWSFWRREIFQNTPFIVFNNFNPDEYTARELLLKCNKVVFCEGVYYYRFTDTGTTRHFSIRQYDVFSTDIALIELFITKNLDNKTIGRARKALLYNIIARISSIKALPAEQRQIANNKLRQAHKYFKNCNYEMHETGIKGTMLKFVPYLNYSTLKVLVVIKNINVKSQ